MAQVTIKLTLEEAKLAKRVLEGRRSDLAALLDSHASRSELTAKGAQGHKELEQFRQECADLGVILREFS